MRRPFKLASLSLLTVLLSHAVQAAPPLAFETRMDAATGENRVTRVLVSRGERVAAFDASSWISPVLEDYAQAAAGIIVAFGTAGRAGLPSGFPAKTGLTLIPAPPGQGRSEVITDNLANSILVNIADDRDGLVLRFEPPLVDGPGPELIVAEAGLPPGGQSAGCPGVPAPGADRLVISRPGGGSITLEPEDYGDFGPVGSMVMHGAEFLTQNGARLIGQEGLASDDLVPIASVSYFKLHVSAVDIAGLSRGPGDEISILAFRSKGERVETTRGRRLCWTADPAFIVGLPNGEEK